jgi:inositol phosphorylceramide mannosyltransferase catalytic subunit
MKHAMTFLTCLLLAYLTISVMYPMVRALYKLITVQGMLVDAVVEMGEDTYLPSPFLEKIPSVFHSQTPLNDASIPLEWLHSYNSCQGTHHRFNTYKFLLYTDADLRHFIGENYAWFLNCYDEYEYNIQRVDASRYFILRHFGGIYIDLDVGCRRSLDNLRRIHNKTLILPATLPFAFSNDFMMAIAEHPFLLRVTDIELQATARMLRNSFISFMPFLYVLSSTGPIFLSLTLFDYLQNEDDTSIGMLRNSDYCKKALFHLHGSSWMMMDGIFITFVYNHFIVISVVALFAAISLHSHWWNGLNGLKYKSLFQKIT